MKVVLYSTATCPRCKILKDKMNAKNVSFEECQDEVVMEQLGIDLVPVLEIDDGVKHMTLGFGEANQYINNL